MTENSRKRSRKSKLVPRECAEDENEFDLEMQIKSSKISKMKKVLALALEKGKTPELALAFKPEITDTQKPNILKKINASAKEDLEPESKSPRKFEIDIEIETCDEEIDKMIEEALLSGSMETAERDEKPESAPAPKSIEPRNPAPIVLTREIVLEASADILKMSTNLADKILDINLRNTIGYEQPEKLVVGFVETRIQAALHDWRTWQFRSFHREAPLFYKCYICMKSYWYLSEFRDHMAEHENDHLVNISLEKYEAHEINIVAYHKKPSALIEIFTPGACYRCGNGYSAHELALRQDKQYYSAKGCSRQFFSCLGVRDHFPWCKVCKVKEKPYRCEICRLRFDTHIELSGHLVHSHCVRSDIPISARYKNCKKCAVNYSCKSLHRCRNKSPTLECTYCFKSFSSQLLSEMHVERSMVPYTCEICGVWLRYSCQKFEHMTKHHTDKYVMVKKCVKCEDFRVFLNNTDAARHFMTKHGSVEKYCPYIFIPTSYTNKSLAVSESVPEQQNSIPEQQNSIPEQQKSIPEQQELIPKEKGLSSELDAAVNSIVDLFSGPGEELEISREENFADGESFTIKTEYDEEMTFGSVKIKEEPVEQEDLDSVEDLQAAEDSNDSLVIKEEPLDEPNEIKEENETENFEHEIDIKEELVEDPEEYEGDLIKLNFDLNDLIVKEEKLSAEEDTELHSENEEELDNDDGEYSQNWQKKRKKDKIKYGKRVYRCKTCGFTANHSIYREHMANDCTRVKSIIPKVYKCSKCDQKFSSMKKRVQHFELHEFQKLQCPECLDIFRTYTSLIQHILNHVKLYYVRVKLITQSGDETCKSDRQCRQCSKTVASQDFFSHWEMHMCDDTPPPVTIPLEDISEEMPEGMVKNCIAQLSTPQPKQCVHCRHQFKRVNECKRHLIEHLLEEAYNNKYVYQELRCQVCSMGFQTAERYKYHMRDHASLPVYRCDLCDRTFSDSSNFTKHKKVHNLQVVVCDLCGKKFQTKLSLKKHLEKHKSTQMVTCKICNKIFYFESSYRRHLRHSHEKNSLGFRCVICSERFDCLKLKWNHMWEVHKERKHKADCPVCHKSFRKYSDVRAHAREEHSMAISVLSVNQVNQPNTTGNNYTRIRDSLKSPKRVTVGSVETLVIYDSE